MGTSVASALTAETVFEIINVFLMSICPCAGAWVQNSQIFRFFNSGYAHDGNTLTFRRRASRVTVNTLITGKSNYASVRQSRDSLHRDRHSGPEKKVEESRGGVVL